MRAFCCALVCIVACMLAVPAQANDALDFLQSPGSESLSLGDQVASDVLAFFSDVLSLPDGVTAGSIAGGGASAFYVGVDKEWVVQTGVDAIPKLSGAAMLGVTVSASDPEVAGLQPVAGLAIGITNIKGGQLLVGFSLCSADLADDYVDLGRLGRFYYAPKIEYRLPLGGN